MFFFKEKISVNDFCIPRCDFIFSSLGKNLMDHFIQNCSEDILLNMDVKTIFYNNFIAVYLNLIVIAIAKSTGNRDIVTKANRCVYNYLTSKRYDDIKLLKHKYSSIFGSGTVDGIRDMAIAFIEIVSGLQQNDDCLKVYRDGFYTILESFFDEIKKVKLIT